MMKEFVLEIGVEEIPSNLILYGMKAMESVAGKLFKEYRIDFEGIKSYGTPRRLILHVPKLATMQAEFTEEIIGPPKKFSFDENGNPTETGLKFAQGQGLSVKDLKVKMTPKGEYLTALRKKPALNTELLLKNVLPGFIQSITFPKSMVWGVSKIRFVRPVRWIAAVYGGKNISFKLGEIKSEAVSYGHRFLNPKAIRVKTFATFEKQLRKQYVLIDPDERKEVILKGAIQLGKLCGGQTEITQEILDQAVFMVEHPVLFKGTFDESFLKLPKEIIINAMCEHQGYFPVFSKNGDRLLPFFVAVSNIKAPQMKMIQKGNERVLRSRLSDARFYFDSDLKISLSERVDALKKVVYQENLGTQFERVERLSALAGQIAGWVVPDDHEFQANSTRAGRLSKADLLTGVVREFPKLQGAIGKEYALLQGESGDIAKAIGEQYLPKFAGDSLPESLLGKILSISDKMDAITGFFGIGLSPTGSEDPYGLRRHAAGLIHILLTLDPFPFNLNDLINASVARYQDQNRLVQTPISVDQKRMELSKQILDFLRQRYEFILETKGYRSDIIFAVTSVEFNDPVLEQKRINALAKFCENPKFNSLFIAYKRMNNILPKNYFSGPKVRSERLKIEEEKALFRVVSDKKPLKNELLGQHHYEKVLELFAEFREPLDRFFTVVMVNDTDPDVRENRLALVYECREFFKSFADFSKIVTEN
ncbi:MAG: glycine--tRNA ligase subunit beta [Nitrospiria bacterium]